MKTWKVIELIKWSTDYFDRHEIPNARLDAEVLLSHLLKIDRLQLYLNFDKIVVPKNLAIFRKLIKQRIAHVPVSYLVGQKEFMSIDFAVDRNVLIPRPETEILVSAILDLKSCNRLLEIGTGSGSIAISLALSRPELEIIATDISENALKIAKKNASTHNLLDRVTFLEGNLFGAIGELEVQTFDCIVSNPPYISDEDFQQLPPEIRENEPKIALTDGADGLGIIRRLISESPQFLNSNGILALEIGFAQGREVSELVRSNPNYKSCKVLKDYAELDRVVVAEIV